MLTKYITIKGEDVFASKPYKDLKVYFSKAFENVENILILDWKPQLSFPRRGQLGLVRSLHHFQLPPRVLLEGWPISIFAMRKLQKIMSSVRKMCISTQIPTVCRDQVRMSTVARSLGRGRQNVLRCREHLLPAGVVLRTWEHFGKIILGDGQDTSKESDSPMSLQEGLRWVGPNHFSSFINLSAGLDIFQPFQ